VYVVTYWGKDSTCFHTVITPVPGSFIRRTGMKISYTLQGCTHPKVVQREENFQCHSVSSPPAYIEWMPAGISPNLHPSVSAHLCCSRLISEHRAATEGAASKEGDTNAASKAYGTHHSRQHL